MASVYVVRDQPVLRILMLSRFLVLALVIAPVCLPAQRHDPDTVFSTKVSRPAYSSIHPIIAIDERHHNFHTAEGTYRPLANLLQHDGYRVVPLNDVADSAVLDEIRVLVIAGASAAPGEPPSASAFTAHECEAIEAFVRRGGSLLLIADHEPDGAAAGELAKRFGVSMGNGFVFDRPHSYDGDPTVLTFSKANGLLPANVISRGRSGEAVATVVAFTGESLSLPRRAIPLLLLSGGALEASQAAVIRKVTPQTVGFPALVARDSGVRKVSGRVMGLAMTCGKGRVAIFGEAAMFTAQIVASDALGRRNQPMGMNVRGTDNRQFVLNVFHWLTGVLPSKR